MTVRDVDRGAKALLARLGSRPAVRVGVIGSAAAEQKEVRNGVSEETVASVATKHEFGIDTPRRSFIADYVDGDRSDLEKRLRGVADAIEKGGDPAQLIGRFGAYVVGQIQLRISQNIPPPLAEITKEKKGSSVALIDTNQLRSSNTYEVTSG